jgi:hypothetical protein
VGILRQQGKMRVAKSAFLIALLCVAGSISAAAQEKILPGEEDSAGRYTILGFVNHVLQPLKKPAFFGECRAIQKMGLQSGKVEITHERQMVIFPQGAAKGMYIDFGWMAGDNPRTASIISGADITLGSTVNIDNVSQGGMWEYGEFQVTGEYVIRNGLRLLYPKEFPSIMTPLSNSPCPNWDNYELSDSADIDKIYKRYGWNRPPKLPPFPKSAPAR